jgi:uncharacterized protein (TIGR02118 family)
VHQRGIYFAYDPIVAVATCACAIAIGATRIERAQRRLASSRADIMIKVSVLYTNAAGKKFDMAYYCARHMPMVQTKLGNACKSVAVEQGLAGATPGSPAPFMAMGHLYFDSVEAFQTAFAPHADAIMGDIPNYTNAEPVIQVSEVKL